MEISTSGSPSASPPVSSHPNEPHTTESEPPTTQTAFPDQQPHQVIPKSKISTSKGAVQRSRQCSSLMQHPRPRSHSLSNQRRDTRLDQDIRTALMKRKNPESSPDEKSSTRDKMHKSGSSIT